jgi:hypothetical protein
MQGWLAAQSKSYLTDLLIGLHSSKGLFVGDSSLEPKKSVLSDDRSA